MLAPALAPALAALVGCSDSLSSSSTDASVTDAGDSGASAPPARLYVTFVSHNEDNCPLFDSPNFSSAYKANRDATVAVANAVVAAGLAWNFESDWTYLLKVPEEDARAGQQNTNGKNIIEWLATSAPHHLEVDAHSHEHGGYNYADVVKLLIDLGAPDTKIVGGFIASPDSEEDWTRLRQPLTGKKTGFVWTPQILWGGASPGHVADLNVSGVWRPKDGAQFLIDDPAGNLTSVGTWWDSEPLKLDGLTDIASRVAAGEFPPGTMLTAAVRLGHCTLARDLDVALADVAAVAALVAEGKAVPATLSDIVATWRSTYGSRPFVLASGR